MTNDLPELDQSELDALLTEYEQEVVSYANADVTLEDRVARLESWAKKSFKAHRTQHKKMKDWAANVNRKLRFLLSNS